MTDETSGVRFCACGPRHGRQDGFRAIDTTRNLWGCGTCGAPTRAHLEAVVLRLQAARGL